MAEVAVTPSPAFPCASLEPVGRHRMASPRLQRSSRSRSQSACVPWNHCCDLRPRRLSETQDTVPNRCACAAETEGTLLHHSQRAPHQTSHMFFIPGTGHSWVTLLALRSLPDQSLVPHHQMHQLATNWPQPGPLCSSSASDLGSLGRHRPPPRTTRHTDFSWALQAPHWMGTSALS